MQVNFDEQLSRWWPCDCSCRAPAHCAQESSGQPHGEKIENATFGHSHKWSAVCTEQGTASFGGTWLPNPHERANLARGVVYVAR